MKEGEERENERERRERKWRERERERERKWREREREREKMARDLGSVAMRKSQLPYFENHVHQSLLAGVNMRAQPNKHTDTQEHENIHMVVRTVTIHTKRYRKGGRARGEWSKNDKE